MLSRSLRIMHRLCRTPPQDVTHPCDVSPSLSLSLAPTLTPCFHATLSLASCPRRLALQTAPFPVHRVSEHKSLCKCTTDAPLSLFQQRIVAPRQLVSTSQHHMTHSLMLAAAREGEHPVACGAWIRVGHSKLMQVSPHRASGQIHEHARAGRRRQEEFQATSMSHSLIK